MKTRILFLIALLVAGLVAQAAPEVKPLRVFYLGNSLTYMGPQWDMLKQLAAADQGAPTIETGYHVVAACSLAKHWTMGQVQEKMRQGKWDFVVLQGYRGGGNASVTEPAEVFIQWIEFVKNLGARPVLYHTAVGQMEPITSPEDRQARHRTLDAEEKFLTGVAQPRGAWVVPGARAHWLARGADPTVLELRWAMFPPGDCHANAVGQYLIACAFYPILTGRQIVGSPWRAVGLPSHNTGFRPNPDSPVLADTEARWLQSVAWTALTGFAKERDLGDGCVLPPAPATTALLDVGLPEPVPPAERIARNRQRRFEFLRKYWADLQANTKTKQPPVTKQAAGWMSFALKALAKDYPDVPLPPDIAAIKATFDALPEK